MTDETFYALLAYFPIMMLLAAVETRAIRPVEGIAYRIVLQGVPFAGLMSSIIGCAFTLITLAAHSSGRADFEVNGEIWVCAFVSLAAGALITCILLVDGWMRPTSSTR